MSDSSVSFRTIRPFVRFAQDISISQPQRTVRSYDHRLFYILSGTAAVEIDGTVKEIFPGNVLYWMSGVAYRFEIHGKSPLHMIAVNFDFMQENREAVQYLPLVLPQDYSDDRRLEAFSFPDAPVMNAPIFLNELPDIFPYMQSIVREAAAPALFSELCLSDLFGAVLTEVCRAASQRQTARGHLSSYKEITDYIHRHYADDLSNAFLAERFGYHPKYISQLIRQQTGTSLHRYLLNVRIRNAIDLLQTTSLPVGEIAQRVGFRNAAYFSEYFRKSTGHSPRAFRVE